MTIDEQLFPAKEAQFIQYIPSKPDKFWLAEIQNDIVNGISYFWKGRRKKFFYIL